MTSEIHIFNVFPHTLWIKSYLIEFLGSDGKSVEDSFTFSVPPESEEITYTQRKTETKTFGGLHVDDYGMDAANIKLSGSTINRELRYIFIPGKEGKYLTGEQEIYYFRDLLNKYKSDTEEIKKKIMLWDLSKIYRGGIESARLIKNYWRVFPGDFRIRRDKSNPFAYKYTLEFTAVAENKSAAEFNNALPLKPKLDIKEIEYLDDALTILKPKTDFEKATWGILDFIDGAKSKWAGLLSTVTSVTSKIKTIANIANYASSAIKEGISMAGSAVTGLIGAVTTVVKAGKSLLALPGEVMSMIKNIGNEIWNACTDLVHELTSFGEECIQSLDDGPIPPYVLESCGMTSDEFKDSVLLIFNHAEDIANELAAAAKSADIPEIIIGNPDPETGEQTMVLSYGNQEAVLKGTDTLESLATEYYGTPDKAIDIAAYNGVASVDELNAGDIIKIPITSKRKQTANNMIYALRDERDNYGRDIYLDEDGRVEASTSGDFKLCNGADNLAQGILLRLRESVSKRVRLNVYGIRTNIGDPNAGIAYILSSIDQTVSADPRVKSVDDIQFYGKGDTLIVLVKYTDINRAGGSVAGRI